MAIEERGLLESWKEISAYLKRSEKTCRRFEASLGLPVHRLDGTPRARVFAYKDELDRWRTEKLHSREGPLETPEELRRRTRRRAAAIASAVIGLAAISGLAWRLILLRSPSPPAIKSTLAVLPFENLSGTEALDWLRTGLPELITTDLLQSRYLDVMGGDRVYSVLRELKLAESRKYAQEDLVRVAKKANIHHLGSGSFMKEGESIIITFNLHDMRGGERISSRSITCQGEAGISDGIDRLTREIKRDLALTPRQVAYDFDMRVGQITTRSPEALKYFMEGTREVWRGGVPFDQARSLLDQASSLLKKAVEIDPGFAMAYRSLGIWETAGRGERADKGRLEAQKGYLRKALELSDRVSLRERYLIRATYCQHVENSIEKALKVYKEMLTLYPDDMIGNNNVAQIYDELSDNENAIKYAEILYEKEGASRKRTIQLAQLYRRIGDYDKVIKVYQYYLDNQWAGDVGIVKQLYESYWRSGKYDLALKEADRIEAISSKEKVERVYPYYLMGNYPAVEKLGEGALASGGGKPTWPARDWLQNIYITQGQLGKAREQIVKGLQEEEGLGAQADPGGKSLLHNRLAKLFLIEGNLDAALKEAEKARDTYGIRGDAAGVGASFPPLEALRTKGEIYIEMKLFGKAEEVIREIRDLINKYYDGIIRERPYPISPREKESLVRRQMRLCDFLTGRMELKRGNPAKAIDHLREARPSDTLPSPVPLSSVLLALAAAYEQAGKLPMAREEYEKIPALSSERMLDGYTYALSLYQLGKICERQNDRTKAVEYFGKFLELWKNADRVFPEVQDARTRLGRLMSR